MKATDSDWTDYLNDRSSRQISIIQIGPAPAWAGTVDSASRPPFLKLAGCTTTETIEPTPCHVPNPAFWQAFESKVKTANQKGLYIFLAGMMEPRSDHPTNTGPQHYPTVVEAVNFAHWLAARLSNAFVVFSPGFDSNSITKEGRNLQSVVGQEIRRVNSTHLVTNHWSTNELDQIASLHSQTWLNFEMIQSGHNADAPTLSAQLTKLTQRAREMAWKVSGSSTPGVTPFAGFIKPTINGEAIYDQGGYNGGQINPNFSDYRARQAGYLSWLSGAAGYSFGVGGIWDWGIYGSSMGPNYKNFRTAMNQSSARSMQYLAKIMRKYRSNYIDAYDQQRIVVDSANPLPPEERRMVLARTPTAILAYLPYNQQIRINYATGSAATTIDPFSGMLYDPLRGMPDPVATPSGQANVDCTGSSGACTWRNRFFGSDPASSDRVLELSMAPARLWKGENQGDLKVFSGKLSDEGPWGVNGWLLDAARHPVGNPFAIAALAETETRDPAAAHDGAGDFLVVWQAQTDKSGSNLGIFGQRVTASGILEGISFRISPPDAQAVSVPTVALDSSGKAVVAWQVSNLQTGNGEIWARTISRNNSLDPVSMVAGGADVDCSQPRAVMSRQGSLTIAWVELDDKEEKESVRLRHFGEQKLLTSPSVERVNTLDAPGFWLINLHLDEDSKLEVEYEARFGARSGGTFLQAFAADGSKLGSEELVASAAAITVETQE